MTSKQPQEPPYVEYVGKPKASKAPPRLMNSERKDFQNKIRQLQENLNLSHTKTLLSVNRILNTAYNSGIIDDEQLKYLQKELRKL